MKFSVELAEVYEDGALIMVEGDDWVVAIPATLGDSMAVIDTEEFVEQD